MVIFLMFGLVYNGHVGVAGRPQSHNGENNLISSQYVYIMSHKFSFVNISVLNISGE